MNKRKQKVYHLGAGALAYLLGRGTFNMLADPALGLDRAVVGITATLVAVFVIIGISIWTERGEP